jgi:hypothetical protein
MTDNTLENHLLLSDSPVAIRWKLMEKLTQYHQKTAISASSRPEAPSGKQSCRPSAIGTNLSGHPAGGQRNYPSDSRWASRRQAERTRDLAGNTTGNPASEQSSEPPGEASGKPPTMSDLVSDRTAKLEGRQAICRARRRACRRRVDRMCDSTSDPLGELSGKLTTSEMNERYGKHPLGKPSDIEKTFYVP